jgi:hypothetical protein
MPMNSNMTSSLKILDSIDADHRRRGKGGRPAAWRTMGKGGGGTQPTKGLGEEKTWHALFDRFTDYRDYSMVSSKWAFRAHSNVNLILKLNKKRQFVPGLRLCIQSGFIKSFCPRMNYKVIH